MMPGRIGYPRTMTSSRSGLLLVSAALLAACGGRSQLRDSSAGSAGSGGTEPTTSVSSGGGFGGFGGSGGSGGTGDVGGSGGMLSGCVVEGQPIGLAGTDGYGTSNPIFVSPVQIDNTTLVAAWKATAGPPNSPTEIRHSSFQAWGAWPANGTIGPSYLASYDGGQPFYAAPSYTDFSVAFGNPPPGPGLTYLAHVTPGSGDLGTLEFIGGGPAQACFLERGSDPSLDLLGFSDSTAANYAFNTILRDEKAMGSVFTPNLGCALDPIVAAAAPFGAEFLVAFASGSSFNDPGCASSAGITTAQRLLVVRVSKDGAVELAQEIKSAAKGATITAVKVVPRPDGAWLAWTDTQSQAVHAVRLDPTGQMTAGPFDAPFFGDAGSISATALGDRLAMAWSVTAGDAPAQVRISVLSTAGNLDADVAINLDSPATGRTAILGSPSSSALLVSWAEEVSPGPQLRLARLACSLP